MTKQTSISNTAERDMIIERIKTAPAKRQFRSDWSKARYLAKGEMIVGLVGGFANSIIFSPAKARGDIDFDRILFYGSAGVLVHEEPTRNGRALLNEL